MQFDSHYSTLVKQMRRAATLLTVTLIMTLFYLIQRANVAEKVLWWVYAIPLNMTPLVCWLGFYIYLFCPFNLFNLKGRKYLLQTFIDALLLSGDFHVIWLSDQFISLSGVFRDVAYVFCYYFNYNHSLIQIRDSCNINSFGFLIITLLPAFLRITQCLAICYRSKSFLPQGINAGKYCFTVFAGYSSYLYSQDSNFIYAWLIMATLSSTYAFAWDLKMDWGFFEKGSKNFLLRNKLSFNSRAFYYYCMVWDFIFRFFFTLTISPQIVYTFIRPEFFTMIILSAEITRRSLWNFIRVEFRHIEICQDFRSTLYIETAFYEDQTGKIRLKTEPMRKDLKEVNERLRLIENSDFLHRKHINTKDFINRLEDPVHFDFFVEDESDTKIEINI